MLPASPLQRRRVVFLHGMADAEMADEHESLRHVEDGGDARRLEDRDPAYA